MPRTVVLGGAGFIGSHLCDAFLARGHAVVAVDNFVTGDRRNLAHIPKDADFELIEQDISAGLAIDGPVDFIMNFASPASPKDFTRLPLEILAVGSNGQRNALELARQKGARILFASTSEVYGDPKVNPQPETYLGNVNCIGIRGCYDESKRFGEAITVAYRRAHGVDARILRIFNTYGPRMLPDDGRALPNFISQALRGEPITIYGDGSQTRSFCYVSDLVAGAIALVESDVLDPVNVGNPDEVSILTVAKEVLAAIGSTSELTFHPLPPGDPMLRRPDITRAREKLGWAPTIDRADGLGRTIAYFRERLGFAEAG